MQDSASGKPLFLVFPLRKWGFSGFPPPECSLQGGSSRFKIKEAMKHLPYLNVVLTVIAINLVLITLAVTGLFPTASAKDIGPRNITVPVGADGTVNVNINQVGGEDVRYRALPVDVKDVDGRAIRSNPLPVVIGK
jgi:hypothetical protein